MVRTLPFHFQGAQVWPLVRELRSPELCTTAKKKKNKQTKKKKTKERKIKIRISYSAMLNHTSQRPKEKSAMVTPSLKC